GFRQPVALITKSALILQDLDLLRGLAAQRLADVSVSLTTLDPELARAMEPRAAPPSARLKAVAELAAAGVAVGVMVAPVIPGLTEREIPALLAAAKQAGARHALMTLLRLPGAVADVFREWLARTQAGRAARVEGRIRSTRGGRLNSTEFGTRMRGTGEVARQIRALFRLFARRHGLDRGLPPLDCPRSRRPPARPDQPTLF